MNNPTSQRTLLIPGWYGSDDKHWQSLWRERYSYAWVEQHDWVRPLRGDWTARLQEVVLASDAPTVLVAHSLGCILTAWWAAHSTLAASGRVVGALLVAPADVEQPHLAAQLPGWAPIVRQRLPFPCAVVASRNDPYAALERTQSLAADWGARCWDAGVVGHINSESAIGDWPQGHAWLQLLKEPIRGN